MKSKNKINCKNIFVLFTALITLANNHAEARPFFVHNHYSMIIVASQFVVGGQCLSLYYDKNGNRQGRSYADIENYSALWGSSVYGCYRWG